MRENSYLAPGHIEDLISEYKKNLQDSKDYIKMGRERTMTNTENLILGIDAKLATLKSRNNDVFGSFGPSTLEASLPQPKERDISLEHGRRLDRSLDFAAQSLENSIGKNKNFRDNKYRKTTGVVNLLGTSDAKPTHVNAFFFVVVIKIFQIKRVSFTGDSPTPGKN